MDKFNLIKMSNDILDNFKDEHFKDITEIITQCLANKKNEFEKIAKESDLKGSNGFYMIFCDNEPNNNQCTCQIKISNKVYYCVYRGHSYNTKERLLAHLFNGPDSKYDNCMLVPYENDKYNINISSKKYFKNKKEIPRFTLPNWEWGVMRIPLNDSKQALREMFESVFDKEYSKPAFCDR